MISIILNNTVKSFELDECGPRLPPTAGTIGLALNCMEIRYELPTFHKFKMLNYLDFDFPEEFRDEKYESFRGNFHAHVLLMLHNMHSVEEVKMWNTGKKGFRAIIVPKFSYMEEWIVYCDPKRMKADIKKKIDELKSIIFIEEWAEHSDFLDSGVLYPGKGVKFDLLPHPVTKVWPSPIVPHGRKISKSCTSKCNKCGLIYIANTWQKLYGMLGLFFAAGHRAMMPKFSIMPEHNNNIIVETHAPPKSRDPKSVYHGSKAVMSKEDWNKKTTNRLRSYFDNKLPTCIINSQSKPVCYLIIPIDRNCIIHGKEHKTIKHYFCYYPDINQDLLWVNCHSSAEPYHPRMPHGSSISLEKEWMAKNNLNYSSKAIERFLSDDPALKQRILGSGSEFYYHDDEFIDSNLLTEDVRFSSRKLVIIKSPMGSGKTMCLKNYIQTEKPDRILAITTRITCAGFLAETFDCKNYTEMSEESMYCRDLHLYRRLVVSMESLHKIRIPKTSCVHAFDLIILDEIESILQNFNSSTMDGKRANYMLLVELMRNAKKVVAMDAFITSTSLHFFDGFKLLGYGEYSIYYNTKNQDQTIHYLYNNHGFSRWYYQLLKFMVNDPEHQVVVVSDSKKFLSDLTTTIMMDYSAWAKKDYDMTKVMIINGDSPEHIKRSSVEVHYWFKIQFLAYTPVITVGNNYSVEKEENVKDLLFGCFIGIVPANVALQMTGRFRKLKKNAKHIVILDDYLINKPSFVGEKKRKFEEIAATSLENFRKDVKNMCPSQYTVIKELNGSSIPNKNQPLETLFVDNKINSANSSENLWDEMVSLLELSSMVYVDQRDEICTIEEMNSSAKLIERLKLSPRVLQGPKSKEKNKKIAENKKENFDDPELTSLVLHIFKKKTTRSQIIENCSHEGFDRFEFKSNHAFDKRAYDYRYLLDEYRGREEELFLKDWKESLCKFVDEYPKSLWKYLLHANQLLDNLQVLNLKYYALSEANENVQTAIDAFYSHETFEEYEAILHVNPPWGRDMKNASFSAKFEGIFRTYLPLFGIYYEKLGISTFNKRYNKNVKVRISSRSCAYNRLLNEIGNPKIRNKVYALNEEKTHNVKVLGDFYNGKIKELTAENYKYYYLFNNQSQASTSS